MTDRSTETWQHATKSEIGILYETSKLVDEFIDILPSDSFEGIEERGRSAWFARLTGAGRLEERKF